MLREHVLSVLAMRPRHRPDSDRSCPSPLHWARPCPVCRPAASTAALQVPRGACSTGSDDVGTTTGLRARGRPCRTISGAADLSTRLHCWRRVRNVGICRHQVRVVGDCRLTRVLVAFAPFQKGEQSKKPCLAVRRLFYSSLTRPTNPARIAQSLPEAGQSCACKRCSAT